MEVIVAVEFPVFVTVIDCEALVVPVIWPANTRLFGLSEKVGVWSAGVPAPPPPPQPESKKQQEPIRW
jgi:hypothetical protein